MALKVLPEAFRGSSYEDNFERIFGNPLRQAALDIIEDGRTLVQDVPRQVLERVGKQQHTVFEHNSSRYSHWPSLASKGLRIP